MSRFEEIALSFALSIGYLCILFILLLILNGIAELYESTTHYHSIRDHHKALCLEQNKRAQNFHFRFVDETTMGFGPDGSYGCFAKEKTK